MSVPSETEMRAHAERMRAGLISLGWTPPPASDGLEPCPFDSTASCAEEDCRGCGVLSAAWVRLTEKADQGGEESWLVK